MQTPTPMLHNCCGCDLSLLCIENICLKPNSYTDQLPIKRRLEVKKNDALFVPNRPFQHLFVIEQGAIKTVQTEADGSELVRGFYFSGEVLGYKAISSGHYQSTAKALCDTKICMIDYQDFIKFLQHHPELHQHIMHIISLQMNIGSYLVSTSADRKLAAFLLDLASRLHRANTHHAFQLPMSRQDIGNYLRLSAETISRILKRLIQTSIITVENKNISILKPDALKKIAEGCA